MSLAVAGSNPGVAMPCDCAYKDRRLISPGSLTVSSSLHAIYHVAADAGAIEKRAKAIAVEQSVEMPVSAISDDFVLSEIVGRVENIRPLEASRFEVRIALSTKTIGTDAGQLLNMLFGNTSLQDDVVLHDVEIPDALAVTFGGPRVGLEGLRRLAGAGRRALTCSALKPQGSTPQKLAALARRMAEGGIDYIKDDHGLADQDYSTFSARIAAVTGALRGAARTRGANTHYIPSLSGDLDAMRRQIALAREAGIVAVMVAPMIAGFSNVQRLVRENSGLAFMAHPTMGGASRISPQLLLGKLFRLLGADAVVFPNYGGRFGYSPDTCKALARAALQDWHGLRTAVPVPAGGMTLERVPEILDFYGPDSMLLVGGNLLEAQDRMTDAAAAFVDQVKRHAHG
jgi:ribulose-bisphosphate carboxylase large chain